MKRKFIAILVVLVFAMGFIAACTPAEPEPPPPVASDPVAPTPEPETPEPEAPVVEAPVVEAPAEENFRVAVQLLPPPNQFHAHMRILIEEAIAEMVARYPNFSFEIFGSTDENDQVRVLETLLDQALNGEWDGIVISPQNGTLVGPVAAQFYENGIPVVIINRLTDPEIFTAYVAGDNPGGAELFAHYIAEVLGEDGGTVFCSRMTFGTPIDRDRHYPFMEVLEANYPNIEYLGSAEGGNTAEMGYDIAMAAMMAHDEINIVYGHDEFAARGFWQAMIDAGRGDEVQIVGFWGGTRELWEELRDDPTLPLRGIAYQPMMGDLAIRTIVEILQGGTVDWFTLEPAFIFGPHNLDEWEHLTY